MKVHSSAVKVSVGQADGVQPRTMEVMQVRSDVTISAT